MDETEKPKAKATGPADTEQHPDYPGLTYGEVKKAKSRAIEAVEKERRAKSMDKVTEDETRRLAQEDGFSTEEMLEITLNLAPDMKEIVIDGKRYVHGTTRVVPASVARELLFAQHKGWANESARLGEDRYAFYAQKANATRAPVVINGRTGAMSGHLPAGTHA